MIQIAPKHKTILMTLKIHDDFDDTKYMMIQIAQKYKASLMTLKIHDDLDDTKKMIQIAQKYEEYMKNEKTKSYIRIQPAESNVKIHGLSYVKIHDVKAVCEYIE